MKPIRTAILGLGRIAWSLEADKLRYHPCTHAGTLLSLPRKFQITGACDLKQDAIDAFGKYAGRRAPGCVCGTSARDVLRQAGAELVIVAASLESHELLVREAVRSGAKAVLLEKPPAMSYNAARKLLKLCRDIPVWVNFERRYHPQYAAVRAIVAENRERLRSIRGRVLAGRAPGDSDSGPLLHDAIHWIDLLLWFTGSPRGISARQLRERGRAEHTSFVRFDYPEFSATLESGGQRRYFEFEMEIDFDNLRIHCGNTGFRILERSASKRYANFSELSPARSVKLPMWRNPWPALYSEIHSALRSGTNSMTSSLFNALEAMRLIDLVQKP